MALNKTLKGRGNADVTYHMIPSISGSKDLSDGTYSCNFNLIGFVDEATRTANLGHLSVKSYNMGVTGEQMAHIIDYLGLYPHVKANDPDFTDAVDVL